MTNRGLGRILTVSQIPVAIAVLSENGFKSNIINAEAFLSHLFICNFLIICYLNVSKTKLIFYIDKADITVVEMAPAKIHLNLINPINPVPYQDLREFKFSIRLFNWSSNSNMGSGNFFVTSSFQEASSEPSW